MVSLVSCVTIPTHHWWIHLKFVKMTLWCIWYRNKSQLTSWPSQHKPVGSYKIFWWICYYNIKIYNIKNIKIIDIIRLEMCVALVSIIWRTRTKTTLCPTKCNTHTKEYIIAIFYVHMFKMVNDQFSVHDRGTVGAAFIKCPLGSSQAAPSTPRAQTPNIGRTERIIKYCYEWKS